jgi:hypothetical protein
MVSMLFLAAALGNNSPPEVLPFGPSHIQTMLQLDDYPSAKDVIVCNGEAFDGTVTVLESWKGDIKPGCRLYIPFLAGYAPDLYRVIFRATSFNLPSLDLSDDGELRKAEKESPGRIDGRRMILLLKARVPEPKTTDVVEQVFGEVLSAREEGQPARLRLLGPYSIIWEEKGHLYAPRCGGMSDPWRLMICPIGLTEPQLRRQLLP